MPLKVILYIGATMGNAEKNNYLILGNLQFCWQVCRCVILAFNNLIAFIQSLENSEGVTNAVQGCQVFCQ